jgi:hypothetical protein
MAEARVEMMEIRQCDEKNCQTFGRAASDMASLCVCTVHRASFAERETSELRCECGKLAQFTKIDDDRSKALQWCGDPSCLAGGFKVRAVSGSQFLAVFLPTSSE